MLDKNSQQTRNRTFNMIKGTYEKPILNIMLNSEKLNAFP